MPKLKRVNAKVLIKKLKKIGFVEMHQRGSHVYFKKEQNIITVPVHSAKDIPIGTLHNIVTKQAGLKIEDFNNL